MEKAGKCPKCEGEMAEFPLVVRRGVPGRLTDVIAKAPIGFYCKKCNHFEFAGIPPPKGKNIFL